MAPALIISKGTELLRFLPDSILCIAAEGNYSIVYTLDGEHCLVSAQLGQVEELLGKQLGEGAKEFIRMGRPYIINTKYIHSIDIGRQTLVLSDCKGGKVHTLEPSRDALIKLRDYVMDHSINRINDPQHEQ